MKGLPIVVTQRRYNMRCEVDLIINPDNPWFQGHFPDQPILPGVVQIGWAVHFASEIYGVNPNVNTLEQIKFRRPMLPNMQFTLLLTTDINQKKLRYEYRDLEHSYSSGTLHFETP
jgi:3-hydroxymyristoyl/3-hydroxydecanoyl-(acyl carrier protein) dehydratase